jgi:AGCS family alanine or glycine:cation symporter
MTDEGFESAPRPGEVAYEDGRAVDLSAAVLAYYDVAVDRLFTDAEQTEPFSGVLYPGRNVAVSGGAEVGMLYGDAVRNSSPLTALGFERGLEPLGFGWMGKYIVLLCVFLFALSTAISWSYYGDRCANYLLGRRAILPYKFVFLVMHFVGAVVAVTTIWDIGDVALSLVTLPNVLTLILLSGLLKKVMDSYFERRPWEENAIKHRQVVEAERAARAAKSQPRGQ